MDKEEVDREDEEGGYSSGELKIVEEEREPEKKTPSRKKKRSSQKGDSSDEESEPLPMTCQKIQEKLTTTAVKNRLTAANVKNILKRVVSNEHVLALVKIREEEMEEEEQIPSPKITRAKAKEIKRLKPQVSWPLPITPVKTQPIEATFPEVTKLIAQDLPDEESDEEYQPNPDEASDDERDTISSMSDVDSQPRTPATPGQPLDSIDTTPAKWTDDGLFKIPQIIPSQDTIDEATIALRTRSKLSLNDTPIEAIEESFVPPDDDFDEDQIDNVWTDFLKEFSNPKTPTEPANEDDEEMDPLYNADHEKVEEEEIWADDDDIEVTRNEFNTLLTELYESMDAQFIADFQDGIVDPAPPNINLIPTILHESQHSIMNVSPVKILDLSKSQVNPQPPQPDSTFQVNPRVTSITKKLDLKTEPNVLVEQTIPIETYSESIVEPKTKPDSCEEYANITDDDLRLSIRVKRGKKKINGLQTLNATCPDWIYKEGDGQLSETQREILDQQMRQHVQIAAQSYVMLYGHPRLWSMAPQQKEFLSSLKFLALDRPNSAFKPCNLTPAIELCEKWETSLSEDSQENRDLIKFVEAQCDLCMKYRERPVALRKHRRYKTSFPDKQIDFILESRGVILYPELLPGQPCRIDTLVRSYFMPSEDKLTAVALEEFIQYANANPKLFPSSVDTSTQTKRKLMDLITRYLVVGWTSQKLIRRIGEIRTGKLQMKSSAVMHYIQTGKAPKTIHTILRYDSTKRLFELPPAVMPKSWLQLYKERQPLLVLKCKDSNEVVRVKEEAVEESAETCQEESPSVNVRKSTQKRNDKVLLTVVDQTGKEIYRELQPIVSLNTSHCITVQSLTSPVFTTQEVQNRLPVKKRLIKSKRKQRTSSSESSIQTTSDEDYRIRRADSPKGRLIIDYPGAESTPYDQNRYSYDSFTPEISNITCNNTKQPQVSKQHHNCKCACGQEGTVKEEPLPKGQTLLTKYFKSSRNINTLTSNNSLCLNNSKSVKKTSFVYSSSRLENISNLTVQGKDQSNCIDSTSITDTNETLWKVSNLHIYNRESYTLKTVLSKLSCLLFVNLNKEALHVKERPSRLKSRLARNARVKLLKQLHNIDSMMLPSMPYLSTPSKSSFDDEFNETEQFIPTAETSKTATVETQATSKETPEVLNDQTNKKAEDKPASNQSKSGSAKLNVPGTASKVNVKTSKAQKELEASRAMFATSDPFADDLKDTTYATAYFEKVQDRLTAKTDEELGGRDDFFEFQNILSTFDPEKETPCHLYFKLEKLFGSDNDDLTEEFLTFLTAGQAVQIGRFMDHFLLTNMTDFIERLQIYFARRPTQLRRILWSLNQIVDSMEASNDTLCMEKIKSAILPHLKGNQYLFNWFMRLFPMDKPQDSMVNSGYEIVDVEKLSKEMNTEEASQIDKLDYEIMTIPNMEDSYGTETCCCECHNTGDEKYRTRNKHCTPCGMKYVQGRLYIPHSKGLRPGRVIWSSDEEARRQAVRLGLVQHRSVSVSTSSYAGSNYTSTVTTAGCASSGQVSGGNRKRAASHEPSFVARESDDERVSPKRAVKTLRTPTSKSKFSKLQLSRNSKSGETEDNVNKIGCISGAVKDERASEASALNKASDIEKLAEPLPSGDNEDASQDETLISKTMVECSRVEVLEDVTPSQSHQEEPWAHNILEIHEHQLIKREVNSSDQDMDETEDLAASQDDESQLEERNVKTEEEEQTWTRDEDKTILTVLQCESDLDYTFEKIRQILRHRSLDEIKERFQSVMQLLQQMALGR